MSDMLLSCNLSVPVEILILAPLRKKLIGQLWRIRLSPKARDRRSDNLHAELQVFVSSASPAAADRESVNMLNSKNS
eukprot:767133-Hanusia_phi.AAC.4